MKVKKKRLWQLGSFMLSMLIAIQSLVSINMVHANVTTLHCLNVWTSDNMTVYKNATDTVPHPQIMYASGTEKPVFCIDLGKAAATGDSIRTIAQADYTRLNDRQKQAIGYVLGSNAQLTPPVGAANGYAGADYTDASVQQEMKWFWSTQLMIWYFIDYYDDDTADCCGMNWAGVEATCNAGWGDLTECNRIWYYVINMMRIPTFAVDYYGVDDANTPAYEMTWNNSSNQYEVILHHTDTESRCMAHYEEASGKLHFMVCNADGTANDDGEYLKVYTTETIAQDSALEAWGYKNNKINIYTFDANDSNPQEGCEAGGNIDAPPVWFKFKAYTRSLTDLSISKQDITTQTELPGCTLAVTSTDGSITYDTWVSGSVPHLITGLESGTYVLKELVPADGYTLANSITFSYDRNSNTAQSVTMYNSRSRVELLKTDETGNPLAGAKLEVRKADGSLVESWTSGSTAHVIEGLPAGNYILKETQAPSGYTLAADKPFTVTSVNQTVAVTMADKKTRVELLKTDETGNPLAGAKLEVRKADGSLVESWTSGSTAHVIEGLPAGNYILKETEAPSGYTIAADKAFTVTSVNQTVTVSMVDTETVVEFIKLDEEGNALSGASLELYDSQNNLVDSWISTREYHIIKNLPQGVYRLHEAKAPEGWTLAEDITFSITENPETVTIKMSDRRIYGNFKLTKTSLQIPDKRLGGATFSLYQTFGDGTEDKYLGDYVTDKNGEIYIEHLVYGDYYLKEIEANEHYYLNTEKCEFEIRVDGETVNANYVNTAIVGVLHVRYDNKFTRGQFVAGTPRTGDVKCPELAMAILMMMLAIGAKEIITHKKR